MKQLILFAFLLATSYTFSQSVSILEKNNVSLIAMDAGNLFQDIVNGSPGYEIPKGSGINAIYTTAFWFGAMDVGGQIHVAAQTFGGSSNDFYAGPYSADTSYMDSAYMAQYLSSIWRVTSAEIEAHNLEYAVFGSVASPSPNIMSWPAHGDPAIGVSNDLAPFVDMNSDGIYDPYDGDHPEIKGCEALYIIFNDAAGPSFSSNTPIMGIEVHVMLYQYASLDFLNDITFMDMRVVNRSPQTLYSFASACYTDADLGGAQDDYMGCDPTRNISYIYNGDNYDEDSNGSLGYGDAPPAIGVMYLNQYMRNAGYYVNGGPPAQSDPNSGIKYWNYMHGKWADGQDWVYGGTGYPGSSGSTTQPSNYLFPHDPIVGASWTWTETDTDGSGSSNQSGDRRMFMSSEQGDLLPGQEYNIDMAIVFGRDTTMTNLENVDVMLSVADSVQAFYDAGIDECNDPFAAVPSSPSLASFGIHPNPSTGSITIELENVDGEYDVLIQDAIGRLVYQESSSSSSLNIQINQPTGIYFVTIRTGNHYINKKLIIE
ncbi:MAG: T9SS type A sorting domain-containing protein [Crocinitomicaceae bacterium]|nr:T9SS type A sorting domain-containing protein [Crocinitomicaceae bacterium]